MSTLSAPLNSGAGSVDGVPQQVTDAQGDPANQRSERGASEEQQQEESRDSRQQPRGNAPIAQNAFSSQFDMMSTPSSRTFGHYHGPYNMEPLANALPPTMPTDYRHAPYDQAGQQRYHPASSPPMLPQIPPVSQYGGQSPMLMTPQGYYFQQLHIAPYYVGGQLSPRQAQATTPSRQNSPYYPNPMVMNHPHTAYYYSPPVQYPTQAQNTPTTIAASQHATGNIPASDPQTSVPSGPSLEASAMPPRLQNQNQDIDHDVERQNSVVRGPPRKPRQKGFAVWIGNLPPQPDLMSLVHHICEKTTGLQSLFLIPKSNCAFANFNDEGSCETAQEKLHESKFQSMRLVSKLRKSTVEGTTGLAAPTGPSANTVSSAGPSDQTRGRSTADTGGSSSRSFRVNPSRALLRQDRFFILKSLTLEDLELSVQTGMWATQSHNEEILNDAFKNCSNVYLIFSANRSGEYFGYARMMSETNQDPEAVIKFTPFTPTSQAANDIELPKAIPTEADEHTPNGRIIDDSARGTIFWEADLEDSENGSDDEGEVSRNKDSGPAAEEEDKTWGKPFRVEWLCTNRLPFYRARGLRNPWNSNREVKIARDGTEVEPTVGRKLIGLFNRMQGPKQPADVRPSPGITGPSRVRYQEQ